MVVCSQTFARQAVDLALRVADEMDVNIGHEVGYSIPLETCCTSETVLRCVDTFKLNGFCSTDSVDNKRLSRGFLSREGIFSTAAGSSVRPYVTTPHAGPPKVSWVTMRSEHIESGGG